MTRVTTTQLAKLRGVHRRTIQEHVKLGRIKPLNRPPKPRGPGTRGRPAGGFSFTFDADDVDRQYRSAAKGVRRV